MRYPGAHLTARNFQFTDQNYSEHRHIINFAETTGHQGFEGVPNVDADQLGAHEGWQFAVEGSESWNIHEWRVHGILIDDTFFVVWLDPNHQLYPKQQAIQKRIPD